MRGLFVTGTDTGAGKTVLSGCLLAAMAAAGEPVRPCKPILTGTAEPPVGWPPDDELLAAAGADDPAQVTPLRLGMPASPHLAAAVEGIRIDPAGLLASVRERGRTGTLLVEGVGGLLVPLADGFCVRDLAVELALPLLVAARPGLGTINHTLLTLEAARAAGLRVAAVVLTPWPSAPDAIERSNRETIASLGAVEVATIAPLAGPAFAELAAAGRGLPWRRWLDGTRAQPGSGSPTQLAAAASTASQIDSRSGGSVMYGGIV